MKFQKQTFRTLFFLLLLTCLLSGLVEVVRIPVSVNAAPLRAATPPHVVISEFRFTGPAGGSDEFIELYNATALPVNISGWKINGSSNAGSVTTRLTIPTNATTSALQPGQYYLAVNSSASAGLLAIQDATYATGIADDGGIALLDTANKIIDQVGLSAGSAYKEGTPLSPLSGTADQSYERQIVGNAGNCNDVDDNVSDFIWNDISSNPQNSATVPLACIVVTRVTASTADGTYKVGDPDININVEFNSAVNVTGAPTLLLETGTIDEDAFYSSGSGTNVLTFTYTITTGDASGDLDYVSIDSLSLNGGSITGAVGDANLILPNPGTAGSLGANKNIVIDNLLSPSVTVDQANAQIDPTGVFPINFIAVFSEPILVSTFTAADINQTGTATGLVWSIVDSGDHTSFTLSVTSATGTGTVIPTISAGQLTDPVGANNSASTSTDNTVVFENTPPTVTVNQAGSQIDPTSATPVNFTVLFSEPINVSSFTTADIIQSGTANFITWNISDSGDHRTFTLAATSIAQNGTVVPSIGSNRVTDLAGNNNVASTSTDNTVTFNDNVPPLVTVNQAVGQADPTSNLPIIFTVVFSEAINPSVFTTADITQNGTATGVTWSIVDSGNHKTFTLSATATAGFGTFIPSIAANRVTDLVGNNNLPSTSSDNIVTYVVPTNTPPPTHTATPGLCGVGAAPSSIIINEIGWAGTLASATGEWIELYNPTSSIVNLNGWILRAVDGTPTIPLASVSLAAGQYYVLERTSDTTISDVTANQIFTGDIGNTSEILQLYNASGICVDTANSNGGAWPAGSSSTFGSMERRGVVPDSDTAWFTNVNSASWTKHDSRGTSSPIFLIHGTPGYGNWAFTVTATPSPIPVATSIPTKFRTATPVPPPPPPLIGINEFVPRPGHDWNNDGVVNVGDEYIELINHGVIDVNLSGYSLDDEANVGSSLYRLPSVTLKPGERMVFYGKETGLLLSDGGDGVRLIKPNGQLGDAYNYAVTKYPDQSYCRLPDNGGLDDWATNCFPTPGLKNALTGNFSNPSPGVKPIESACPISDVLPLDFVWAECPSFGNIWSRFYWDALGWFGEKNIPNDNSKWDVYVD